MKNMWSIVSCSCDENIALVVGAPRLSNGEIFDDTSSADEIYIATSDPRSLGDRMALIGGYFVVSNRAKRVLESSPIDEAIDFVRVFVEHPSAKEAYWLVSSAKRWSVIDREQSTYTYYPGTTVIGHVDKWVLDACSIPSVDLFQGDKGKWFCSSFLQSRIILGGLSGFRFDRVLLSDQQ